MGKLYGRTIGWLGASGAAASGTGPQFASLTIAAELTTICTLLEQQRHGGQVRERLPSASYAWLRPADDEPRFWITDDGRHAMRSVELFACADD